VARGGGSLAARVRDRLIVVDRDAVARGGGSLAAGVRDRLIVVDRDAVACGGAVSRPEFATGSLWPEFATG